MISKVSTIPPMQNLASHVPRTTRLTDTSRLRTTFNDRLALALLAILFLAAIPFGSNRPFFWALWTSATGLVGTVYFASLRSRALELSRPLHGMLFLLVPFLAIALFICLQLSPTGAILASFGVDASVSGPFGTGYFSLTPGDSWLSLCRWITYGLVFLLAAQLASRSRRRLFVMKGLFSIVTAQALYSLAALTQFGDTILFFDKWAYEGVATGTFVNRNSLATFLALGLVIGSTYLLVGGQVVDRSRSRSQRKRPPKMDLNERVFWAVGSLTIFSALLSTQSRMGIGAALIGVLTALLMPRGTSSVSRRAYAIVAVSAVAAVAYFGFGFDRFLLVEKAAETRIELYRQVIEMIVDRPLMGFGAGSFEYAYPLYHAPPVSSAYVWERAHSTYLQLWSELGVVAGSVPIIMVVTLLVATWRGTRRNGGAKPEQLAMVGAVACVAVHSLVDFSLEIEAVALLFVVILAIGSGEYLGKKQAR